MLVSDTKPAVTLSDDATIETKRTDSGEIHCFQSVGGKATVFLEAMPTFASVKHITHIDYALEPLESEFHTSRQDGKYGDTDKTNKQMFNKPHQQTNKQTNKQLNKQTKYLNTLLLQFCRHVTAKWKLE